MCFIWANIEKIIVYLCINSLKTAIMESKTAILPIVERDEWLQPVADKIADRHQRYQNRMEAIAEQAGTIVDYANGYRFYGWQYDDTLCGWWFREWLPGAEPDAEAREGVQPAPEAPKSYREDKHE